MDLGTGHRRVLADCLLRALRRRFESERKDFRWPVVVWRRISCKQRSANRGTTGGRARRSSTTESAGCGGPRASERGGQPLSLAIIRARRSGAGAHTGEPHLEHRARRVVWGGLRAALRRYENWQWPNPCKSRPGEQAWEMRLAGGKGPSNHWRGGEFLTSHQPTFRAARRCDRRPQRWRAARNHPR
jgi:hypothetical protein